MLFVCAVRNVCFLPPHHRLSLPPPQIAVCCSGDCGRRTASARSHLAHARVDRRVVDAVAEVVRGARAREAAAPAVERRVDDKLLAEARLLCWLCWVWCRRCDGPWWYGGVVYWLVLLDKHSPPLLAPPPAGRRHRRAPTLSTSGSTPWKPWNTRPRRWIASISARLLSALMTLAPVAPEGDVASVRRCC